MDFSPWVENEIGRILHPLGWKPAIREVLAVVLTRRLVQEMAAQEDSIRGCEVQV